MTTREEIFRWLGRAIQGGATHMIVATDTFDWSDYPVYVAPDQDAAAEVERLEQQAMTKVMEVYNLALPLEAQLDEYRAFHL
jgi:hypothetical protein